VSRLLQAVHRFWFAPVEPARVAILRIVTCTYVLYTMLGRDLARLRNVGTRPLDFMDPPLAFNLIPIPFPLTGYAFLVFAGAMAAVGIMAAVGLFTRPALLLFALGYVWMGAAISSWGYVTHSRILPIHVLLILAFAPGAAAWSVDRLVTWGRGRMRGRRDSLRSVLGGHPVPGWGAQLTVVLIAILLFAAGASKVRHAGFQWADGQTLGFYLAGGLTPNRFVHVPDDVERPRTWRDAFVHVVSRPGLTAEAAWKDGVGLDGYLYQASGTIIGRAIAERPSLLVGLSAFTLILELAAPLLLFGGLIRSVYLLLAASLFIGIWLAMGIAFHSWSAIILCLVDWRRLFAPLRRVFLTRRSPVDGARPSVQF
jgi:hypothetical protein